MSRTTTETIESMFLRQRPAPKPMEPLMKPLRRAIHLPKSVICWLYGAYLTLRYVDQPSVFPAFTFSRLTPVKISKAEGSRISVQGQIRIAPWLGHYPISIRMGQEASLVVRGDFILGDDVHIRIGHNASLILGGKENESGSGITARCVILVSQKIEIGKDVMIAWDTFITDSDWHTIEGQSSVQTTVIGDHVWIGTGAKILKGCRIGNHSIVAAGAVVTSGVYPNRALLGGVPAQILRNDIADWSR